MLKAILGVFAASLFLSMFSSCVKVSCCGLPDGYTCTKDSISVAFLAIGNYTDSLNFYTAKGYTCLIGAPRPVSCVRGTSNIREAQNAGDVCVDPHGAYYNSGGGNYECEE